MSTDYKLSKLDGNVLIHKKKKMLKKKKDFFRLFIRQKYPAKIYACNFDIY